MLYEVITITKHGIHRNNRGLSAPLFTAPANSFNHFRITSYNVCYTKLLRIPGRCGAGRAGSCPAWSVMPSGSWNTSLRMRRYCQTKSSRFRSHSVSNNSVHPWPIPLTRLRCVLVFRGRRSKCDGPFSGQRADRVAFAPPPWWRPRKRCNTG